MQTDTLADTVAMRGQPGKAANAAGRVLSGLFKSPLKSSTNTCNRPHIDTHTRYQLVFVLRVDP